MDLARGGDVQSFGVHPAKHDGRPGLAVTAADRPRGRGVRGYRCPPLRGGRRGRGRGQRRRDVQDAYDAGVGAGSRRLAVPGRSRRTAPAVAGALVVAPVETTGHHSRHATSPALEWSSGVRGGVVRDPARGCRAGRGETAARAGWSTHTRPDRSPRSASGRRSSTGGAVDTTEAVARIVDQREEPMPTEDLGWVAQAG